MFKSSKAILLSALLGTGLVANAQNFQTRGGDVASLQLNTITTAVPFLLIAPDSRAGGMGDVGVATSPDANATHWNPAKLAFADLDMELSVSYTPWLRQLVPDINLAYLSMYKRLENRQTIGASLRYFSLGDITFTDAGGNVTGQFKPNEFAVDLSYARQLSDRFSSAISGRFIFSNLTGGATVGAATSKPGVAGAADVSFYYQNDDVKLGDKDAEFAWGLNISNIGSKIQYTSAADRDFIPINLRLGPRFTANLDDYNKFTLALDFNKLLVPTPPIFEQDTAGQPIPDGNGSFLVASGRDPNVGVASGIFGSFSDAPGIILTDDNGDFLLNSDGSVQVESGSRFKEELREINIAAGLEYWYDNQFALRAGYFYEHPTKGNRQFFTLGAGLRFKIFALDFAYLIPTVQQNPLANTLRFTLKFRFDDLSAEES